MDFETNKKSLKNIFLPEGLLCSLQTWSRIKMCESCVSVTLCVCPAGVHFCTMWLLKSVIFDFLRPYFKCKIRETGWSFLAHSICTMWLLTHNSPSGHLQGIRNLILRGCDFGSPQAEHLKIDFEREISQNRIFSPAAGYFPPTCI